MAKLYKASSYDSGTFANVGANSASVVDGDFVTDASGVVSKAVAGGVISGISATRNTFASDNQTVALEKVSYYPIKSGKYVEVELSATTGAEAGKYYDITADGKLDVATESLTTGQLLIVKLENGIAVCEVVNA